ncbi:four-carbon acid sugar kinase family protein [Streptomonospora sp. S1-112]|uniref:Four-carbon acid sugar kinase family protein n=1 Tax=Streptomonospora mangrovi TaxID=2883123 RepID=A0A9X3NQX1_9ACTN|nr:four-carbon acid sugar kinase family protein [Streptomonospora mangrovi]MDA0567707.1 four-carbon acid sugar kinase family protein [Streptomonospora mangrovi]
MSPVIALVADDLTGANDTGVRFLRAGWSTELQLGSAGGTADVVAVSTDSRAMDAEAAAAAVAEQVRRLHGARHLYKKVDSTLRGQLAAEVEAARRAWAPDAVAVVCPAFPEAGRTVVDGVLLVDGVPAHETPVGTDPVTPVRESHIPTLLGAGHVRLAGDGPADPAADAALIAAAGPVVVADARTDADLERLAAAIAHLGPRAVPVGSAGLAAPMAGAWAAGAAPGTALVVVTSLHAATRGQVERLAAGAPVEYCPAAALAPGADGTAWKEWHARVEERLAQAPEILAVVAPEDRALGLDPAEVAHRFGVLTAELAHRHGLAGLVVTGGDGARAVVDALGATGIALTGEVEAGIPAGTLTGGPLHGLPVVTKAGGFGDPDALITAATAIRHRRHQS